MTFFRENIECSGCTACMNICPVNAIAMVFDQEGFKYPSINKSLCVECGQCVKVCPFKEGYRIESNFQEPEIFAVKNNDIKIRIESSSGGVFSVLSDYILENNGVVYGVVFDEEFIVTHQKALSKKDLDKMRGSKYVQSELNYLFREIKEILKDRLVLFSGTPCQTAGLYSYLGEQNKNLILCDLVCSGVGSPKIFGEYIQKNYPDRSNLMIKFRDKKKGWQNNRMKITNHNNVSYFKLENNPYLYLFMRSYILRPSCFYCKFTNFYRPSDITLADFWGIEKTLPAFSDNMGVSLVLLNSQKGINLFNKVKPEISYTASDKMSCTQRNLYKSKPLPHQRESFFRDYIKYGYSFIETKYTAAGFLNKIKIPLKSILRKIVATIKTHY